MKKLLLLILCLSGSSAFPQQFLTLEEAIAVALEKNLDVRIARNEKEIATLRDAASQANFLPEIDGTVSTQRSVNAVRQKLSSGSDIERDAAASSNLYGAVTLNYTLFDGLKMFAIKNRTGLEEEHAEILMLSRLQDIVAEVTLTYYEVVSVRQQLRALEEIIAISEERVRLAEARFSVGTAAKSDLLQSRVDLNAQKSRYLEVAARLPVVKAELNTLMGRETEVEFEVVADIPVNYSPDRSSIAATITGANLGLRAARKLREISEMRYRELRAEALPVVEFNSAYVFSETENQAGFLLMNRNKGYNYGFSVSIPLFRGFLMQKGLKAARIQSLNSDLAAQNVQRFIWLELKRALAEYDTRLEMLRLEEENILLSSENMKIALERFRLAQTSVLELKEAQQSHEESQNRLIIARYNAKQAEIALRKLNAELVR